MKRTLRKMVYVLLVLSLVLACIPATAGASPIQLGRPSQLQTNTIVIPGAMDPDQRIRTVQTSTQQVDYAPLAEVEYLTDYSEAGAILRKAMKNREASVSIPFEINFDDSMEDVIGGFLHCAVSHTGNPTEGDYLDKQRGEISVQYTCDPDINEFQYIFTFNLAYYTTAQQEAQVDTAVEELLSSLNLDGMTDYEKLCAVYDWMCANITYDDANLNDETYNLKYTAYAALIDRTAVCQGYATLLYRLMLELGIDCRLITGIGNGGPHAWNIVELGGLYYNLDATWDATWHQAGAGYNFFLRADDTFEDHSRDAEFEYAHFREEYPMTRTDFDPDADCIHNYTSVVTNPTCTEQGYTTRTCDYCGDSYTEYYKDAFGHSISDWITSVEPTETTYGRQYRECWTCGYTEEREILLIPELVNTMVFSIDGVAYLHDEYGQVKKTYTGWMTEVYEIEHDYSINAGGYMTTAPWFFDGFDAERVIIEDGVNPVSTAHWFDCWENLTSITIPASITNMGYFMFHGCFNLEEIWFEGDAPSFHELTVDEDADWLDSVTAYYPAGNATWTEEVLQNYGRNITWVPYEPGDLEDNVVDFGVCGDNLTWRLTDDGVLTISGTGEMYHFTKDEPAPWSDYLSQIKKVVLADTVTSIGNRAFYYCSNLTDVTFGSGVTNIGSGAFYYCPGLTSVTIPDSVTAIGDSAFGDCTGLRNVTIGNGVTAIIDYTFGGCSSLESITIPDGVTEIGNYAFAYCAGLTEITIPDSVTRIGSRAFERCSGLESLTIGNGMTVIDEHAFTLCENLTQINLGGATSIGSSAFCECDSLKSVTIPQSVTNIDWDAFSYCDALTEIRFEGDAPTINSGAFNGIIATAYYPAGNTTWTADVMQDYGGDITWIAYGEGAAATSGTCGDDLTWELSDDGVLTISGTGDMYDYSSNDPAPWVACGIAIRELVIADTVTSIGDYAFKDCELTSVTLPSNVTRIGSYAFARCGLTSVVIPDGVTSIGDSAFYGCINLVSIATPGALTSIGSSAFEECSSLTGIIIPDSVISIGDRAFYNCTNLTSATIGKSVTSIGQSAFYMCTSLTEVSLPDGVTMISESLFNRCTSLTTITMGDGVTSIGNSAFYGCDSLTGITIPAGVTSIGDYAFNGCGEFTEITIPNSVTSIGGYAFAGCNSLTSITIPDSVTSIGESVFDFCSSLTTVTIGNGLTSISDHMFSRCISLTSITIPRSITSIGRGAFSNDQRLTEIVFEGDAPSFGVNVFSGVTATAYYPIGNATWTADVMQDYGGTITWAGYESADAIIASGICGDNLTWELTNDGVLTISGTGDMYNYTSNEPAPWSDYLETIKELVIADTVTSIGDNAFNSCFNLTNAVIPNNVTSIGNGAFCWCSALTSITIPDSVTSIGNGAFQCCNGLTSVSIGNGVTSIGEFAFCDCTGLTEIVIPDGVTSIGNRAFTGCNGLTSVSIGNGVISIGDGAFNNCTSLAGITIPDSVTSIGTNTFAFCSGLMNVTIGDGVDSIGDNAFYGCTALTEIVIPDSVTSLGMGVFNSCSGLVTVTIGNGVTSIADWTFSACTSLMNINLGGVTKIGDGAFLDCTSLISVTIPDGVTRIGNEAFRNCTSLTTVIIGQSVTDICSYAFDGCTNLWHILYKGTEDQWNNITIWNDNASLSGATRHCNCNGTEVTDAANKACKICDCDHVWDEGVVTVAPSCETDGERRYTCAECGYSYTEVISAPGHSYTDVVTAPSCTTQGYTTHTCTTCGYEYTDTYVEANGHSYTDVVTEPTCKGQGYTTHTCSVCGHSYQDNYVDALEHNYTEVVTEPTCTEQGYTTGTCTGCGDIYMKDLVDPLGHDYTEWYVETEPSEYTSGQERRDCQRCGYYETNYIPPLGHTHQYEAAVTAPTCTEQGYTTHTCHCGDSYVDSYVDALGHSFGEWETVTEPTETTEGYESRTCGVCGITEGRTIPVLEAGKYADGTLVFCADGIAYLYGAGGVVEETYTGWMTESYPYYIGADGFVYTTPWANSMYEITAVIFEASVAPENTDHWFMYCSRLASVTIADGLTIIGENMFFGCNQLTNITIPASVTTIGLFAFSDCENLNKVVFQGDAPAIGEYAFHRMTATAYYPAWNTTWTADVKQGYMGTITWVGYWDDSMGDAVPRCVNGHPCMEKVTEPTCTESGYTDYFCPDCGDSYVSSYVSALGHATGEWTMIKGPTCAEEGEEVSTCTRCGHQEYRAVEKLEHTYKVVVTEPTCTEGGFNSHICVNCGATYTSDHVDALGHTWDEGVVTKEPTTEAEGEKTYTCTVCGETRTEAVAKKEGVIYDIPEDDTVTIPDNDCFEGGTTVTVKVIAEGETFETVTNAMENVAEKYVAYEFTATKDDVAVQPNGKLTVTFDIPEGYSDNVSVYYMDENGKLSKLDAVVDAQNRTVTVELEHFSTYILADRDTAPDVTLGDVNGDGRVNARDARALLRYLAGMAEESEIDLAAADFTGDGKVNARDARAILRSIAGLE